MSLTVDHTTLISIGVEVEDGVRYLSVRFEDLPGTENPQDLSFRFTDDGLADFASRVEATLLLNSVIAQIEDGEEL